MLANTYHLMLRPGAEVVADLGGLHGFMDWPATSSPTRAATRSSRSSRRSTTTAPPSARPTTATSYRFTPESAVAIQEALGADIQMVLDVCPPLPSPSRGRPRRPSSAPRPGPARARAGPHPGRGPVPVRHRAGRRRRRPAGRERRADRRPSASTATASAGCRWGSRGPRCCPPWPRPRRVLPADQPRYLMGVGRPGGHRRGRRPGRRHVRLRAAHPPRPPRHGPHRRRAAQPAQRSASAPTTGPLDPDCACAVCARRSRAYLRHLLKTDEPTGPRLLTLHNLAWLLDLVHQAGAAIRAGTLADLRREVATPLVTLRRRRRSAVEGPQLRRRRTC